MSDLVNLAKNDYEDTEGYMLLFYEGLNEKNRRRYLAIESKKLGYGGIKNLSELFKISEKTIRRGIEEIGKKKGGECKLKELSTLLQKRDKSLPKSSKTIIEKNGNRY